MARAGMLALLGGAGARTSSCHVDNVAEALILAATRGSPGEARSGLRLGSRSAPVLTLLFTSLDLSLHGRAFGACGILLQRAD
jgi:hypothetical protein